MYIWPLLAISTGCFLGCITIFYNIRKFKKQGFFYYLPKGQRSKGIFSLKLRKSDVPGVIKILGKEKPEKFNHQIKILYHLVKLYLIIAIIFLILFLFIQM